MIVLQYVLSLHYQVGASVFRTLKIYLIIFIAFFISLRCKQSLNNFCIHPSKLWRIGVPNSRFVLKVIIKSLISKLSLSSILKTPNRLHPIYDFQPNLSVSEYLNQIPYCYSTWYSTSIKSNSRDIFE